MRITAEVFDAAGDLPPIELRSLDALHIAAAMTLGADLAGIVVYHDRLARRLSTPACESRRPARRHLLSSDDARPSPGRWAFAR